MIRIANLFFFFLALSSLTLAECFIVPQATKANALKQLVSLKQSERATAFADAPTKTITRVGEDALFEENGIPFPVQQTQQTDYLASSGRQQQLQDLQQQEQQLQDYRRGLVTIGFCTLVFASMTPVLHAALGGALAPPVLLLNAAVSVVAFLVLLLCGSFLERLVPLPANLQFEAPSVTAAPSATDSPPGWRLNLPQRAGLELGLWKFLGTTANLYGLSLTTADHGAFLIQLTTLIVPVVQGLMGVPIPRRIQVSVALALAGVAMFTQDHGAVTDAAVASALDAPTPAATAALGDALCVVAAGFYATYDLRLFGWGKQVSPRELITNKIATQAGLSVLFLLAVGRDDLQQYWMSVTSGSGGAFPITSTLLALVAWSGIMVNAIVPYLQVGGQQAIGPTRSQTLYASQPLWAAMMSYAFLGETVGLTGLVGGGAFLTALFLAATAEAPDPNCDNEICEV